MEPSAEDNDCCHVNCRFGTRELIVAATGRGRTEEFILQPAIFRRERERE